MPEEPLRIAQFDHVSDGGDLVFVCDHRHFAVRVDDSLERGILEAKQIRAEEEGYPSPQSSSALPISRIQSFIRAGADSEDVARQFNIAQALVRRFSMQVETEKKYAIDQFLTVAIPPNSKAKSYGDLIEMTLRNARIPMSAISWSATRRGHEPWRIRAQFQSSGRIITADWTWNIRDNSVKPINRQAKRLIGQADTDTHQDKPSFEQLLDGRGPLPFAWMENASDDDAQIAFDSAHENLNTVSPAQMSDTDSVREVNRNLADASDDNDVNIGSPLAYHDAADGDNAREDADTDGLRESSRPLVAPASSKSAPSLSDNKRGIDPTATGKGHASSRDNAYNSWMFQSPHPTADANHASTHENDTQLNAAEQHSASSPSASSHEDGERAASTSEHKQGKQNQDSAKKKTGRSAVPSWDEILFGD